jgi:N-acetylglucosaminyl-diphospho-decaprenol L-rhamnosyltransferase
MSVSAVVVSYNVRELLVACVASLVAARDAGELHQIVVVDNGSGDGSAAAIRDQFPDVSVVEAENRGYGAGANIGIGATGGDDVLILNPDTVVPAGTIAALAGYLAQYPDVAIVGPLLRYPSGEGQSSRRRFPTRWTALCESTIVEMWWPDNPAVRRFRMVDDPPPAAGDAQRVDWIVGAALLVRRAAIERVGGFDESFRMYSEEVEWCWRLRQHGWKVAWLPAVEIVHHEGASSRQDVSRRQLEFDTSRVRLTRWMYGDPQAGLIRAGLLLGYTIQFGIESGKWLLGHRRDLRTARMRLYLDGLRSGLRDRTSLR